MALSSDELTLIGKLKQDLDSKATADELLSKYNDGLQRVEQLGLAVPPKMRRFLVVANWCQVVTDTIEGRQNVRSLILPDRESEEPGLRAIWDANNLDSDLSLFNLDRLIYGRAFMSVGANEDDPELPIMAVESPREVAAFVDVRKRRIEAACKFYDEDPTTGVGPHRATLYLPDETIWVVRGDHGDWVEEDRDQHRLHVVPMVLHLNRRRSGPYVGRSELAGIIPLVDAAARSLTNMQFAQEAHGVPQRFALGVSEGDFVDKEGKPIPAWEAYFNAIWMNRNPAVKVGQFTAADLKNFDTAITMYGKLVAVQARMPARYFGFLTTNPPAEGAIRADEAQLVETVERMNTAVGTTLGWAMALASRIAGRAITGNRVRIDWHDPGTPTYAQRADAIMKMRQTGILSREGAWDELGWSEARKAKEQAYFEAEEQPELQIARELIASNQPQQPQAAPGQPGAPNGTA